MKTKGTTETLTAKAMKTMKTKFQETVIRSAVAVISLLIIASSVDAKDLQKKQSPGNQFNEKAMIEKVENKSTTGYFLQFFEEANDPALETEEWMLNSSYFQAFTFLINEESEAHLELEEWMLSSNYFYSPEAGEKPLQLENWMVSQEFWESLKAFLPTKWEV